VDIEQMYCEEVKGKMIEIEKENGEVEVEQHYCGEEVREVIDVIPLNEEVLEYEWSEKEKGNDELEDSIPVEKRPGK